MSVHDWNARAKKALVDGMLYEVFFNSKGEIRPKSFKAQFYQVLLREIDLIGLESPYGFINSRLHDQADIRFVPEVHTDKHYTFEFEYAKDQFGQATTKNLKINGEDVSEYFILGAKRTYEFLKKNNCKKIILKDGSPSCGISYIYDGSFSKTRIRGFEEFSKTWFNNPRASRT